ncbi:MAG: hypothetical protein ACTSVV_04630 [Promethearchaeota archaeon]
MKSVELFLSGGFGELFYPASTYSPSLGWVYLPYMIYFFIPFEMLPFPFNILSYMLFIDIVLFFAFYLLYDLDKMGADMILFFFGVILEVWLLNINSLILLIILFILYKIQKAGKIKPKLAILLGALSAFITFKLNWLIYMPFILLFLYRKDKKIIYYYIFSFIGFILLLNSFFLIPNLFCLYAQRISLLSQTFSNYISFLSIRVEHLLYLIPSGLIIIKMLRAEFKRLDEVWMKIFKKDVIFYITVFAIGDILWIFQLCLMFVFP